MNFPLLRHDNKWRYLPVQIPITKQSNKTSYWDTGMHKSHCLFISFNRFFHAKESMRFTKTINEVPSYKIALKAGAILMVRERCHPWGTEIDGRRGRRLAGEEINQRSFLICLKEPNLELTTPTTARTYMFTLGCIWLTMLVTIILIFSGFLFTVIDSFLLQQK